MVEELRHAFELVMHQPEGIQRYIAELIANELSESEIEVTDDLAAELALAQAEITAGDVRDFEAFRRELNVREQN